MQPTDFTESRTIVVLLMEATTSQKYTILKQNLGIIAMTRLLEEFQAQTHQALALIYCFTQLIIRDYALNSEFCTYKIIAILSKGFWGFGEIGRAHV